MEFDPNQNSQMDIDPIEQMNQEKNKTKSKIIAISVMFFSMLFVGVCFYLTMFAQDTNKPKQSNKPIQPDCSQAYDCELYTKSEYKCKVKSNNEEKEIKCPWTEVKENQYKKTEPTVVTSKEILDEYKSHLKKNDQWNLENYDKNWINVEYRPAWNNMNQVGDKGTIIDKNNNKIEYVCTDVYRNGEEDADADADFIINDTFKVKDNANCECGCMTYYTNKEYYIGISFACSCGGDKDIVIYDKTGKELIKDDLYACDAVPYIENNVLYYIAIQNDENNDYDFIIKKVDFNKSKITAEVVNYFNGERTD